MVPQSFVFFSDKTPEWIDKSLMLGDTELYQHLIGNEISEHAEDLFIPYISREVMSLEKQKDFFCQYGVAEARNYLQDDDGIFAFIIKWRKLASWYHREIKFQYAGSITFALYLIIIISLLTAGVSWRMEEDYNRKMGLRY